MLSNSYIFISIVGILVLITLNIFLYLTHKKKIITNKKNYELKVIENLNFEKDFQKKEETFFSQISTVSTKVTKKYAILVGYDYDIQFASFKNSEKLEDYQTFLKEKLNVEKIFTFKNNYDENIKQKIVDALHFFSDDNSINELNTQKIIFIHFFTLFTCVKLKKTNQIVNAICVANDLLYEEELKKQLIKFKNFQIYIGFEPSNNVNFFLALTAENKNQMENYSTELKECKNIPIENFDSYTRDGNEMLYIPIDFLQTLKPISIQYMDHKDLDKTPVYKYNYNAEKNCIMDSLVHSMSHKQLAYYMKAAFSMYFKNNFIDFVKLSNFLHNQKVKQFSSFS